MTNPFAPPPPLAAPARPARRREDLLRFIAVVVGCVLLGAPAGLLWSAVAPHYRVERTKGELPIALDPVAQILAELGMEHGEA